MEIETEQKKNSSIQLINIENNEIMGNQIERQ